MEILGTDRPVNLVWNSVGWRDFATGIEGEFRDVGPAGRHFCGLQADRKRQQTMGGRRFIELSGGGEIVKGKLPMTNVRARRHPRTKRAIIPQASFAAIWR